MTQDTQTQTKISDAACEAAAAWWARSMERPKFDAMGKERDSSMEMAQVMMSMIQAKHPASPMQLADFRGILASRLRHDVQGRPSLILSVDYHPDGRLEDAAIAAGIDLDACPFPIKTTMWLDGESVRVRHGYGADLQTVYRPLLP